MLFKYYSLIHKFQKEAKRIGEENNSINTEQTEFNSCIICYAKNDFYPDEIDLDS